MYGSSEKLSCKEIEWRIISILRGIYFERQIFGGKKKTKHYSSYIGKLYKK